MQRTCTAMKLQILAIGRARSGAASDLWTDYAGRIDRLRGGLGFREFSLREFVESAKHDSDARKSEEAQTLLKAAKSARLIVLDESGDDMTSAHFAQRLGQWRDDGEDTAAFVIGGPDGLDAGIRKTAANRIRFGRQTWPHLLVRAMLAEQIYRAMTILAGHPYHRQ